MEELKITLGCDPEVFVVDKVTGKFLCAHDMIPGTKKEPHKVPGGAIQVDGCALEYNVDPCSTVKEWRENNYRVRAAMEALLPKGVMSVVIPTANFDPADFAKFPDKALELGCEPDYDAYTGEENVRPTTSLPFRTGAGHVHIGWTHGADINDPDHIADCREVVKQLDFYIGLPSMLWDADTKRRTLYGKAGAFRPKSYGVEYRSLSNAWLPTTIQWGEDEARQRFIYDASYLAVRELFTGRVARTKVNPMWPKNVMDAIVGNPIVRHGDFFFSNQLQQLVNMYIPKEPKKPQKVGGLMDEVDKPQGLADRHLGWANDNADDAERAQAAELIRRARVNHGLRPLNPERMPDWAPFGPPVGRVRGARG